MIALFDILFSSMSKRENNMKEEILDTYNNDLVQDVIFVCTFHSLIKILT